MILNLDISILFLYQQIYRRCQIYCPVLKSPATYPSSPAPSPSAAARRCPGARPPHLPCPLHPGNAPIVGASLAVARQGGISARPRNQPRSMADRGGMHRPAHAREGSLTQATRLVRKIAIRPIAGEADETPTLPRPCATSPVQHRSRPRRMQGRCTRARFCSMHCMKRPTTLHGCHVLPRSSWENFRSSAPTSGLFCLNVLYGLGALTPAQFGRALPATRAGATKLLRQLESHHLARNEVPFAPSHLQSHFQRSPA